MRAQEACMERELEVLAARPGSPAELPFQALVEAAGGRTQVLLVGELWEREQSRALLRDFARALFPPEPGDCKPEPGDYNPEPGDCNPESGDCKPEPGDCNPEPGDCKPEPEDCKPEPGDCNPEPGDCKPEPEDCKPEPGDCKPEPGDCKPEPGDCKPSCAEAEGAGTAATRPHWARGATSRAIRSPLVFVLCRASSLAAREPRRRLREMLRDVRGRRRAGAALVGVLVADAGFEDSVTPGLRLLEALLRAVFRGQLGGPVQAAAYCPGHPASSRAIQAAACRALQAAGPGRPAEGAWERPGLPRLLACFPWGPWNQRKDRDATPSRGPAQEYLQVSEEEVALTAIFPNGDCEDCGSGSRTQDGVVHMSPEPTEDARFSGPLDCP